MTEIACFKVTEIQLHLLKQLIRVSIKMMNYYMLCLDGSDCMLLIL